MKQQTYNISTVFVDDIAWEHLFSKKLPEQKSTRAAGHDVVAVGEPKIVGEREPMSNLWKRIDYIEYRTGIKISPEDRSHVLAFPRSSVSKYNLILANSIGLIDNDYRGEIILRFKYIFQPEDLVVTRDKVNQSDNSFMLGVVGQMNWERIYRSGDRICQFVSMSHSEMNFKETKFLSQTDRGEGGLGSTGK